MSLEGPRALGQVDIAFVQIATGEGVQAIDLDTYAMQLNESWPLLLDESDASTGKAFPSGATDAVIVIDSAGFVTSWNPGTMSAMEIEEAVESATRGSKQSYHHSGPRYGDCSAIDTGNAQG